MAVKVAINGFGRIGRLAFRQMFGHEGSEIVAINDLTSPDMLAYLLKYDSTQGNYSRDHKVEATEDSIIVDGKEIKIYAEADANNLPWGDLDVDVVLECTGFYTSKAKAQAHINAGAKKVVISAPAGNDLPTIVYNVNHEDLTAEDNIISAASCTTNCLAPMAKGLNDFAPIVSGIMLVAGFCPKLMSLIATVPQPVLGGATITVFAAITLSGIQLISEQPLNYRNRMIVGISLALGVGIASVPEILQFAPQLVQNVFGSSLVVAFIVAFVLNMIVPEDDSEE